MENEAILPDLQGCVLCEDVRREFNGMQTLVGVLNVIPTPQLPINVRRYIRPVSARMSTMSRIKPIPPKG